MAGCAQSLAWFYEQLFTADVQQALGRKMPRSALQGLVVPSRHPAGAQPAIKAQVITEVLL